MPRTIGFYNAVKEFFYQFQTSLLGNSLIFVTGFDMVLSWFGKGFAFLMHQWISRTNYKCDGATSDEIGSYFLVGWRLSSCYLEMCLENSPIFVCGLKLHVMNYI